MPLTLADCLDVLHAAYDPATAEGWDAVGLVAGDPADPVERIHLAVDPTEDVVAEALELGAQLLVTHHPLLLRGATALPATTAPGRILRALNRSGGALLTAHTNADVARPGVSDALLERLGIDAAGAQPLRPTPLALDALTVYVPTADRDRLLDALSHAGAGRLGDYARCAWWTAGTGTFEPGPGSQPAIGAPGSRELVDEDRLDLVVPAASRAAVLRALRAAHPYEEPAFWTWPLTVQSRLGLGRVAELAEPTTLGAFTRHAANALPRTSWGVRAKGDPATPIRTVAVCGGSGGDLAATAKRLGADVLLTADLRHHPALDSPLPLIDAAHWATERPWCDGAASLLRTELGERATVTVSDRVTDPWSLHACPAN